MISKVYPAIEGVIEYLAHVGHGMAQRTFDRARPQHRVDAREVEISVSLASMGGNASSNPEFG